MARNIRKMSKLNSKKNYDELLLLLEDAHLSSQPYAWPHFVVHWQMLSLALKHGQWKEVMGQIPRLILAMPGSWLGKAPEGNIGSTRMGIFEKGISRLK